MPAATPAKPAVQKDKVEEMEVDEMTPEQKAAELKALFHSDIKMNVTLVEKAVTEFDARYMTRAVRALGSLRKRIDHVTIQEVVRDYPGAASKAMGLMDTDQPSTRVPEVEMYIVVLAVMYLHDKKDYGKAKQLSKEALDKIVALNRRTMDQIGGRLWYFFARFCELEGKLSECRPTLLAAQRTATLRRDDDTLANLINLLLRSYLHDNLYDQADKLVSRANFPESASNNQMARYLYYLGRIKAIQLDYTSSHRHLQQAVRKAPQSKSTTGFHQAVNKLNIIVQLLMGEIPERSLFRQATLRKALMPYLHITQAVRIGDLAKFQETLANYAMTFRTDRTYTLILRLRHNVIKTGIRMISLSYARISLRDIALKLQLDSEEDAEYIVAKAIRDGVIDATLDHEKGYMKSKDVLDVYSTTEPQLAFHQRIQFCLNLHNESVKAMRFPMNAHKKEIQENAEDLREEERKLAAELAEGDLDEDADMGDF